MWRYLTNKSGLWRSVVASKYGIGDHKWFPNELRITAGVGVWKGIRKGWNSFGRHISFEVGTGSTVLFWKDKWCGDEELWRTFPNIFSIATDKDCMVNSVRKMDAGKVVWHPNFRRNCQDWQITKFLQFFELLYSQQAGPVEDRVI